MYFQCSSLLIRDEYSLTYRPDRYVYSGVFIGIRDSLAVGSLRPSVDLFLSHAKLIMLPVGQ